MWFFPESSVQTLLFPNQKRSSGFNHVRQQIPPVRWLDKKDPLVCMRINFIRLQLRIVARAVLSVKDFSAFSLCNFFTRFFDIFNNLFDIFSGIFPSVYQPARGKVFHFHCRYTYYDPSFTRETWIRIQMSAPADIFKPKNGFFGR